MLGTKIRTIIIALTASVSVAGVVAPTVAQAETKSQSGPSQQETCDKLYGAFEWAVETAAALYKQEGNGGTFKAVLDSAESALHEAENQGCDWAASVVRPRRPTVTIAAPVVAARPVALYR